MEIEKLKQKILDLAIRGKLVPQDPDDEPASVLIDKIRAEKEKLIKEGKIKRDKNESYIYKGSDNCYYEKIGSNIKNISDEIPFEIPSTWSWQKIKAICEIKGGKRIPKGMTFQKEKTDHIYIRVTDMKDETISEDNLVYISDSIFNLIKNYTVSKEDLYVTVAGTIGRCGNVPDNFDGMNLTENADKLTNLIVNKEWVLTVLTSKYAIDAMNYKAHQVAQPKLSIETLGNIFIPIPPKNEIRKILSIIKDSKALLSNLDKEIISLEDIVNQTKQKILEHFFGENSCYKSYYEKEYNLDELLPYEQPRPFIVNSTNYSDAYETPVLTPGKSFILGYTNETEGVYDVKDSKVIIFDDFTTASRLIDFNFKVKSSAIKILHCSDKDKFDIDYLFYKLQRINVIPDTHKRFWISEYAPLKLKIHTINEQKKIVKVITDSFTILDSMSKSI
jgi:type I restriction enzyme S subunit